MTRREERRVRAGDPQAAEGRDRRPGRRAAQAGPPVAVRRPAARPSSPAASASGWRWPGRSPSSPRCCCSTSRSAPSTPRSARSCASGCAACTTRCHVTTVFVTHDQEEALEVADEIVVINDGRIEQVGTPDQLYDEPANDFVMGFLGEVTQLGDGPPAAARHRDRADARPGRQRRRRHPAADPRRLRGAAGRRHRGRPGGLGGDHPHPRPRAGARGGHAGVDHPDQRRGHRARDEVAARPADAGAGRLSRSSCRRPWSPAAAGCTSGRRRSAPRRGGPSWPRPAGGELGRQRRRTAVGGQVGRLEVAVAGQTLDGGVVVAVRGQVAGGLGDGDGVPLADGAVGLHAQRRQQRLAAAERVAGDPAEHVADPVVHLLGAADPGDPLRLGRRGPCR